MWLMSAFFLQKQLLYFKQQCENYVRVFLVLFSVFVRQKVTVNKNVSFTDYASGTSFPDCCKLNINRKNDNDVTICGHDVIVRIFKNCFVSLVKFSYWSRFHAKFIIGPGLMTIFFYQGLTRFREMRNTSSILVLTNISRLGRDRDTKFGTNVSSEMLLNTAKCKGYSRF